MQTTLIMLMLMLVFSGCTSGGMGFSDLVGKVADLVWGLPSIIILVGTGIYLTFRMGFVQIRGFRHSFSLVFGKAGKADNVGKDVRGEVSYFQALTGALSATVGTGNIAGVATAVSMGGPGAVFWMWVTALFGMATKFTSCTLAVKYRDVKENGEVSGGPMYTLKKGLNMPFMGLLFALFTLIASFGIGNMVQANSVVSGLSMALPLVGQMSYKVVVGVILALLVGLVILGGVKRIAKVASYLVPIMSLVYCFFALLIIAFNLDKVPSAIYTILDYALNPYAFGWGMVGEAVRYGVARGVFSNEAGLGSSPMIHAASKTEEPVKEGLVAMLEPFIDTLVICSMTALVIVITGVYGANKPAGLLSADLTAFAFGEGLAGVFGAGFRTFGTWVVGFGLITFAYSTVIAWSYYGDRSAEFLFGKKAILPYRVIYTILIVVGATIPVKLVWQMADITNMLMALPNIISLLLLSKLVKRDKDTYFHKS